MPGRPRGTGKRPEGARSEPQASGAASGKRRGARSEPELLWSSAEASGALSGWEPIYAVVRRIPPGRVATYGDVAALAGMPRHARQVGWALNALDAETDVPWQRVINARGEVSLRGDSAASRVQRALLESEGVVFGPAGRVDLAVHGWRPRQRTPARTARSSGRPRRRNAKRASRSPRRPARGRRG